MQKNSKLLTCYNKTLFNLKDVLMNIKSISIFLVLSLFSMSLFADKGHSKKERQVIKGSATTGANILLGEPVYTFPDPWGEIAIPVVGEYNPNGVDPFPLTPSTSNDAVLASRVADFLQVAFPLAEPHNVPLSETLTAIDGNLNLGEVPSMEDAGINEASSARPAVTLGDWLQAEGKMHIKCNEDGAKLTMRVKHLIPGGLYSLWQTRGTVSGGLAAVPAGGIPNFIVPDENGKAVYKRNMTHCPLNTGDSDEPVLMYELAYHSDSRVHGAVPDLPDMGYGFGWSTHTQLTFPVLLAE